MSKTMLKGILAVVAVKWLGSYRRLSFQLFKIEVAKSYLHGVRVARWSVLRLIRLQMVIAMICFGLLFMHAALLILLPWRLEAKATLGMCLGLIYVVVGAVMLRAFMDEKTWIEKSGVSKLMRDATSQNNKH